MRHGRGFSYHDVDDTKVTDAETLERIRGIVIPPAWTDVRISADPDSHLQAVGRDQRGRLQYKYHPDWTAFRDRVKFDHLPAFERASLGPQADRHRPRAPRRPAQKVLATVAELLQTTLIRVGNGEYAENGAYGLTTLRNKHAHVSGAEISFMFTGKSGIEHEVAAHDRRIARVLRECQEIPGQRLSSTSTTTARPARPLARRQRLPPRHRRHRHHRQGLPHVGRRRSRPPVRSARWTRPSPNTRRRRWSRR